MTSGTPPRRGRPRLRRVRRGTRCADIARQTITGVCRRAPAPVAARSRACCCSWSSCVRAFLVTPFGIPSASMQDTLLVGDRILVSRTTAPGRPAARRHRRLRRVRGVQPARARARHRADPRRGRRRASSARASRPTTSSGSSGCRATTCGAARPTDASRSTASPSTEPYIAPGAEAEHHDLRRDGARRTGSGSWATTGARRPTRAPTSASRAAAWCRGTTSSARFGCDTGRSVGSDRSTDQAPMSPPVPRNGE